MPTSAIDLGAAAKVEGSAKAALRKDRDALYPPSAIRGNTMATPGLPPLSQSPPSTTDVAITGPSWRSLDAEYMGVHPLHPPHGQFDIV